MKRISLVLICLFVIACAIKQPERVPLDRPLYEPPTMSLQDKAELLHQRILDDHLNEYGYLLYNVFLPLHEGNNYAEAHNSADLPTWHGNWLMALAFKQAVEPDPENIELIREGIVGIRKNFEATCVTGLLARAYLEHPSDERDLGFLQKYTPENGYETKYWMKGCNGFWFRNGIAKGHYQGAMLGFAAILGLEHRGAIELPEDVKTAAQQTAIDIVHHLIGGDYKIRDWDGKPTDFGNLSDYRWNGQSAVQVTAMLRTCALAGSELCKEEYLKITTDNSVGKSISVYGNAVRNAFGRVLSPTSSLYKPNDTIHAASAALAHYLVADPELDKVQLERNAKLVRRLAGVADRDRNTFFNFIYALVDNPEDKGRLLVDGIYTLKMFPSDKRGVTNDTIEEQPTDKICQIANIKLTSHYWKTTWSECWKAAVPLPLPRATHEYSGQDYLGMYWMGRYFLFISEEEANSPVDWQWEMQVD